MMYLNNKDLVFLIELENKLGCQENWSPDVHRLWELNERLIQMRKRDREKVRVRVAEKRKINKNYARSTKK